MSNVYYLTKNPCERSLNVGDSARFVWDGQCTLILYLNGGRRTSSLHFNPGDAIKASQEGNIIKLSRLEPPHTLPGIVLWACLAEKDARVKDMQHFHWKLDKFMSTHRILEPEPGFSPIWKPEHRIKIERCTGPFLFIVNEEKLKVARYAKHKGTMWATVAAYCDPDISADEAEVLIEKHGIINAPQWYIRNSVHNICSGTGRNSTYL